VEKAMIAKLIHDNAKKFPDKKAIVKIDENGGAASSITFGELDRQAGSLAALLAKCQLADEKVILLFPAGIDFVVSYIACHYAGVIAVPVTPPDAAQLTQTLNHLSSVMEDSGALAIMTTTEIKALLPESVSATVIVANDAIHPCEFYLDDKRSEGAIAHIQYSSGTTGQPKGVLITQANLLHSLQGNSVHWLLEKNDVALTWTPHYYIYGLLTGILLPLYNANTNYILDPMSVANLPFNWLRAISRYKVTYSGCANFAYQLCVDKISADQVKQLDLRSWKIAICGGESIQLNTLRDFSCRFHAAGFKAESLCPSYGMSEMTGFVSAKLPGEQLRVRRLNREYVSSGKVAENTAVSIIDPQSLMIMPAGEIGEICLRSPTKARAYVTQLYETLRISGKDYYRTGDLGFLHDDELYLVSRLKEIIIVNGKNYHPEDIEAAAKNVIAEYPSAAFSVEGDKTEDIVLLQEIRHGLTKEKMSELINAIRQSVLKYCGVRIQRTVLLREGSSPKTRSGKLQRNKARQAYLDSHLMAIHEDLNTQASEQALFLAKLTKIQSTEKKKFIEQNLQRLMQDILKVDPDRAADSRFFDLGMTSLLAIEFKERLQSLLEDNIKLSPSFVFEYPSIQAMAAYIERNLN
jgi:polyketide synthase PksL